MRLQQVIQPRSPGALFKRQMQTPAQPMHELENRSQGTCLLPFGILEKHGPHMPIGSDLLNARYAALQAAEQQYAVVFPESLLPYFAQSQLDKPHDYVVYLFDQRTPATGGPKKKTSIDAHAGESETSKMMIVRPDLLHQDRATSESGADQQFPRLVGASHEPSAFARRAAGWMQPGERMHLTSLKFPIYGASSTGRCNTI
jgi:creatinine amidohydrolase/Fe(II)-dependent formamide hydrolase-like protein